MIVFEDNEVVFACKETGKLTLSIPIKTILDKLKKKAKVKFPSPYFSKEDVDHEYFPKLSGVNFSTWLSMNFEQTKSGKRSLSVYSKILNDLVSLLEEYGIEQLNDAIFRCNIPQKCTIAYLKAILRNRSNNNKNDNKKVQSCDPSYQRSIEHAIKQIM